MTWFRNFFQEIPDSIGCIVGSISYIGVHNFLRCISFRGVDDLEGVINDVGRGSAAYLTFSGKHNRLYNWAYVIGSFVPKLYQFSDRISHDFGVDADPYSRDLVYHAIWVSLMIGAGLVVRQLDIRADE